MDWSLELRTYRARNGLKQEALADLLQISQAYVSRLESGKTEPKDGLEHKIRSLIDNPAQRDVLDFVLNSVRVSPHIGCVLRSEDGQLSHVALSDGFRAHPQFRASKEGNTLSPDTVNEGERLIRELIETGAFHGEINCVEILWYSDHEGIRYYWDSVLTPIRAGQRSWYLYCAMAPLSEDEFQARFTHRGRAVTSHRTSPGQANPSFTALC